MLKGNPMFSKDTTFNSPVSETMSYAGVGFKSLILWSILFATAIYSYGLGAEQSPGLLWGSLLGGFVIAMVTIFKPGIAPFTSPVYAALEGIVLGAVSVMADIKYPGVAMEAMLSTSAVFLMMLFLYTNKIIVVTDKLAKGIFAAMAGILVIYLSSIILSLFGITMPVVNDSSPWGIAFSIAVVCVASASLLLDFERIKDSVEAKDDKRLEWYYAFGLMISLVWLYLEILRLLKKTKD